VCCLVCIFFICFIFFGCFSFFFCEVYVPSKFFVCFCISYLIIFGFSFLFGEYLVYFYNYISLNIFCCNI
jgi:hypothetical protein